MAALDNAYVLEMGIQLMQIPVAARYKACVCGLSLAGILRALCCQRSLRRADPTSRGMLPCVMYVSVIVKPQ